ncbi:outer membrane beta-barrel protein [Flectobacillus sp. DC10W]|jgi:hypothetical protein|uniref:Outer membrane beta-barrel protein n=1 Tax=Flectobacillus longus TaxID=2984207 RepID=A0ABT6YSU6_9BACT|nr:outer membrane beta-barrel protein [Flectobacillus longus]MDI9866620.1 outer membrane beta-barrel protein [Flectobacillus longus]
MKSISQLDVTVNWVKLYIIAFFMVSAIQPTIARNTETDSTVIKIDKRNQTVLEGGKPNVSLKEDIQALFQKSGMTLDDATWIGIRRVVNSDITKDTVLVISQNNKTINVAIKANAPSNATINSGSSGNKGSKGGVSVGLGGVHIQDGRDEVHVSVNGVVVKDGSEETRVMWRDTAKVARRNGEFASRSGFNIYFGLNSFTNTGSISGVYNTKDFELSPFGSRYFGFGWTRSAAISKGSSAALKISYGLEFSWYNFMYENNRYEVKGNNNIEFKDYVDDKGQPVDLSRNKLTVAYINLPVMPYVAFKKSSTVTYIGFGGYVGYRLDSYTKTKESDSGRKLWNHSSFYLNNLRYGLAFELGLKDFPDLFVNYDLSQLYQTGYGPKISGLSFGIRF